uniref:Bulb-type lectin domain-containing protein n=1 Tax=Odontella aurita TaxID=265563 RepID=A0A7S4J373_9STRA|mmetsp:Transcript_37042/g.110941  ORF Transcript_37042/g.110941 Transcript_37042/m.110941 type:complete len:166 (+) Transcript_37042:122-619(+)
MKISWINALIILPAISSASLRKLNSAAGSRRVGIEKCKYVGDTHTPQYQYLFSGEFIKRGEGICTKNWTFGITEGKGKLQLLKGKKVMWTSRVEDINECKMQMGGAFVCTKSNGEKVWALNCGGQDGAGMELNDKGDIVLEMLGNKKEFQVNQLGNEVGDCDPKK